MKRYAPWAAFAVIVAIAAIAVLAFDCSAIAHAHGISGQILADAAAGTAAAEELLREFKQHHTEVKAALSKSGEKHDGLDSRMTELEQKLSQLRTGGAPELPSTWGRQVVDSDEFKSLTSNFKGRARFKVKSTATLTSASAGAAGDAGALVPADRRDDVITLPRRRLRMRDVFSPGSTKSNSIEWPRQSARSNNAATVAEGNLKPQSDITFDMPSWPVRTIATWMIASRQILDDAPALQSAIDAELRYDLSYVEDAQLLNGGGTGSDLTGVYTNATPFASPFIPTAAGNLTKIDILLQAIAQVQQMDYDPDFIAINPLDWADILSIKDEDGNYLGAGPFSAQADLLWKLPVVTTRAMALDKFLVGPGKRGAQIFDRQEATVELSTEDGDNFRKNLVTVLAEERLAFAIKAAGAFVKGGFTEALAS